MTMLSEEPWVGRDINYQEYQDGNKTRTIGNATIVNMRHWTYVSIFFFY